MTSRAEFFTDVYHNKSWESTESASGYGSDRGANTSELTTALPDLFKRHGIKSMLDVPCGDFNWMREVDLRGVRYVGGDIVPDLIEVNRRTYDRPGVSFEVIDVVTDALPAVDLLFCRDCFIHMRNALVVQALHNIARSPISWVCLTHDTAREHFSAHAFSVPDLGCDPSVGVNFSFRPVRLDFPPFNLPEPMEVLRDGPGWEGGKAMALWPVAALRSAGYGI